MCVRLQNGYLVLVYIEYRLYLVLVYIEYRLYLVLVHPRCADAVELPSGATLGTKVLDIKHG